MKAVITGASSGIGYEIAKVLSKDGYSLVLVSRDEDKLEKIKKELECEVQIIVADLSNMEECKNVYDKLKDEKIDLLVNNAGFGVFGEFYETDLDRELNMVDLNVKAVHMLTKLFLNDMARCGEGKILNVASIAGVMPGGPLIASYYACKAYVLNLTRAVNYELKKKNSKVRLYALCPGPVNTNFNNVAGVKFNVKPMTAEYVAKYAVSHISKKKCVIIPGITSKLISTASKLVPNSILLKYAYKAQMKKM